MLNNSTVKVSKRKVKETVFKPESNQPTIKHVITPKPRKEQDQEKQMTQPVQREQSLLATYSGKNPSSIKKRDPPTQPEINQPSKRLNMDPDKEHVEKEETVTGDNNPVDSVPGDNNEPVPKLKKIIVSPKLLELREMLKEDMKEMLIKPLELRMMALEESHVKLEEKGELINEIKKENIQLRKDCEAIMVENSQLKHRIDMIENKLMSSNVILHGISDQQCEPSAITREKALSALSHVANGKTSKEKLDVVRKIGFRDIRRLGEYREHRNCPILLEFEKRVSAEFLLENRKQLPRGVFVDREYSEEVERERRLLRPILKKAKSLREYKMKSKLEGGKLIIQGKSYSSKTVHLLPEPLTGYNVTSKESDSHVGFFGELNPLSNFHPAPFTHEGITFHSSEQWIQYQKAKLFNDEHTAQKILESDTALKNVCPGKLPTLIILHGVTELGLSVNWAYNRSLHKIQC